MGNWFNFIFIYFICFRENKKIRSIFTLLERKMNCSGVGSGGFLIPLSVTKCVIVCMSIGGCSGWCRSFLLVGVINIKTSLEADSITSTSFWTSILSGVWKGCLGVLTPKHPSWENLEENEDNFESNLFSTIFSWL